MLFDLQLNAGTLYGALIVHNKVLSLPQKPQLSLVLLNEFPMKTRPFAKIPLVLAIKIITPYS